MNAITYLLQSSVVLTALYLIYLLLLRNQIDYTFNRIYLLLSIVLSMIVPFVNIPLPNGYLPYFKIYQFQDVIVSASGSQAESHFSFVHYFSFLFFIVSGFFLLNYVMRLFNLVFKIRKNNKIRVEGFWLIESPKNEVFSFFRFIFLNNQLADNERQLILLHEQTHAKYWHTLDKLFVELWFTVQWFNPFAWLLRNELTATHEYAVDSAILQNGKNKFDYQEILLNKLFGTTNVQFIHYFNHSLLKKRIIMMSKNTKRANKPRLLLVATLALAIVTGFSFKSAIQQNMAKSNGLLSVNDSTAPADVLLPPPPPPPVPYNGEIFVVVENSAEFQNGNVNDFRIWVQQNIQYPADAKKQKLAGKVIAQFLVDPNGNLRDVKIVRGIHPLLDNEVKRVLQKSPVWKPAKQAGKVVAQQFVIPIMFN